MSRFVSLFWANQKGIRNPRGNLLCNWVKRPDDQKLAGSCSIKTSRIENTLQAYSYLEQMVWYQEITKDMLGAGGVRSVLP